MTRLQVPIWHTDLTWLPGDESRIATVSGLVGERLRGETRVYDLKAQRRPVIRTIAPLGDVALSAVAAGPDGRSVFVGSVQGDLGLLDLRKAASLRWQYKGAHGAIVGIQEGDGQLFAASMDRHTRVYDVESRRLIVGAYLHQRQRAVVPVAGWEEARPNPASRTRSDGEEEEDQGEAAAEAEDDDEAVREILGSLHKVREGGADGRARPRANRPGRGATPPLGSPSEGARPKRQRRGA